MTSPAQEGINAARRDERMTRKMANAESGCYAIYEVETLSGAMAAITVDLISIERSERWQECLMIENHLQTKGGYRNARFLGHYDRMGHCTLNEVREYRVMGR